MSPAPNPGRIEEVAAQILRYRRDGKRLCASSPKWMLDSEAEADAIQDRVAAMMGEPVHGWKLGATDGAARTRLGLSKPFIGRVFQSRQQRSPARLSPLILPECNIESEVAFCIGCDVPPRPDAYTHAQIKAAISSCHPAFEIVDFSWPGRDGLSGLDFLADNGGCGGMVVGAPVPGWQGLDLRQESIDLQIDGRTAAQGRVKKTADELIEHILWFANHLSSRGMGIAAGQFVTTGTWTGMQPLRTGQSAVARFSSMGSVQASMAGN